MLSDQHVAVEHPDQMICDDCLDRLAGEDDRDSVGEPGQPDHTVSVDPALHPVQTHRRLSTGLRRGDDRVDHQDSTGGDVRRELEPFDRRPHPQRLVRPDSVVLLDPDVQSGLQLLQGGVLVIRIAEELGTNRLVPALHFPCPGRRTWRGEQVSDTVSRRRSGQTTPPRSSRPARSGR
jgi:hypothetical protein